MNVYSITISATRNELDHEGVIPDANWPAAWECYESMMRGAAVAMWESAEVEVIEQPSVHGIVCGADDGQSAEAEEEFGQAAGRVYEIWCEWVSNQPWATYDPGDTYNPVAVMASGYSYQ